MTDLEMARARADAAGFLADVLELGDLTLTRERSAVFSRLFAELDTVQAENAALRAIALAVDSIGRDASGEIVTTSAWISTCPFCQRTITGPSDFQALGHRNDCIVEQARALLAKEAQ